jgi:hypothetical protein
MLVFVFSFLVVLVSSQSTVEPTSSVHRLEPWAQILIIVIPCVCGCCIPIILYTVFKCLRIRNESHRTPPRNNNIQTVTHASRTENTIESADNRQEEMFDNNKGSSFFSKLGGISSKWSRPSSGRPKSSASEAGTPVADTDDADRPLMRQELMGSI